MSQSSYQFVARGVGMKLTYLFLLLIFFPVMVSAEVWSWTDSKGVVNYTSDPKNLPESLRKEKLLEKQPVNKSPSVEKNSRAERRAEDSKKFVDETVEKITTLSLQIENGLKYVDEYHEKARPVSKSVMLSYLNSLSYEISNLKEMASNSPLSEEIKKKLQSQTGNYSKKYNEYNNIVNDFDSITVSGFKSDKQIDYLTTRIVDPNLLTSYNNLTAAGTRVVDAIGQVSYVVTEENHIFTFSATVSNSGSMADITVELNGLNYQGTSVKSHVIKTSVGSDSKKDIGDRIVLARGAGLDISNWVIADVKIVRKRK